MYIKEPNLKTPLRSWHFMFLNRSNFDSYPFQTFAFVLKQILTIVTRKSVESQHQKIQDKKDRVRRAVENNQLIDTDLKRDALELQVAN